MVLLQNIGMPCMCTTAVVWLVLSHWGWSAFIRTDVILLSYPRGCRPSSGPITNWFMLLSCPEIEHFFPFGANLWLFCFSWTARWDPANASPRGGQGLECTAGKQGCSSLSTSLSVDGNTWGFHSRFSWCEKLEIAQQSWGIFSQRFCTTLCFSVCCSCFVQ